MRYVVTGVAGFVGSHLAESLIEAGNDVVGIDCLTDYYDVSLKRRNLAALVTQDRFEFLEQDVLHTDWDSLLGSEVIVLHMAAQPGVRSSWGVDFAGYLERNVQATQTMLEAAKRAGVARFVYASSSSVYGNARSYPTFETDVTQPRSPYGVTKLAAENLCSLYGENFGVPTVSLRFHTVFGPRQRPDMAMTRLIAAAVSGDPFPLFGALDSIRDFTYVADIVDGVRAAAATPHLAAGAVYNLSGGESVSLRTVIQTIEALVGEPIRLLDHGATAGDVSQTGGSSELAASELAWRPRVQLRDGLAEQVDWFRQLRGLS